MKLSVLFIGIAFIFSCSGPRIALNPDRRIDYSNIDSWAALPQKQDLSDLSPEGLKPVEDGGVDIFFLYPTSLCLLYTSKNRYYCNLFFYQD